jgi:hypothetical protein
MEGRGELKETDFAGLKYNFTSAKERIRIRLKA